GHRAMCRWTSWCTRRSCRLRSPRAPIRVSSVFSCCHRYSYSKTMKTLDVGEPRLRHAGTHFEISAAVSGPGAWWLRDGARLRFEVPVDAPPPAVQGDPF